MATISDSGSVVDGLNSPQSRRAASSRNLSSPWSQVVRGGESEAVPATNPSSPSATIPPPPEAALSDRSLSVSPETPLECSVNSGNGNAAARAKKPAWNKPSNGVVEVGPVMGASWPALSESARASPKSSSDSLKALADGSVAASASQVPVIASSPQKPNTNNTNPNSTPNHAFPIRQKSTKRGSGGSTNNGALQLPPSVETTQNASDKPAAAGLDSSPRDVPQKNNNWEATSRGSTFGSQQLHAGNDQPRISFRRVNGGGPHPRGGGDGTYHNNYGSRRDQDRQNFEWTTHQNRDVHMRQQRAALRSFVRPPPFISPPPVRPYGNPIGFPDLRSPLFYLPAAPPESRSGVIPYVVHAAPPGMFISALDPQLHTMLVKQIEYYFSPENLCKDIFLRQKMDEQGWVPISLIASFNRVKQLTMHIHFILEAVRSSTVVEVQGDKIRKRNDWMNWLLPPPNLFGAVSPGPQSPSYDKLATQMQKIGLEETADYNTMRSPVDSHAEGVITRSSSSGEPNSLLQNREEMAKTTIKMGSQIEG